jgi:hypothetical protein
LQGISKGEAVLLGEQVIHSRNEEVVLLLGGSNRKVFSAAVAKLGSVHLQGIEGIDVGLDLRGYRDLLELARFGIGEQALFSLLCGDNIPLSDPQILSQSLIAEKEEGLTGRDGTSHRSSELIPLELGFLLIEEVPCVEIVVPMKPKSASM